MNYKVDQKKPADRLWHDRVLVVWEEDDARSPDRERNKDALRRISGRFGFIDPDKEAHLLCADVDDTTHYLYRGGWVLGWSCGLGFVGVLVKETEAHL